MHTPCSVQTDLYGNSWSRLTEFGEIAPRGGVYGTSSNDVWVSLTDGRMLRLRKSGLTNDPPQITTHPTSATGVVGSTVNFAVTARGTPPLRYSWQFNFTNIFGATNPVLALTGLRQAMPDFTGQWLPIRLDQPR